MAATAESVWGGSGSTWSGSGASWDGGGSSPVVPFVPTDLGATLKLWLRSDLGVTGTSPVTAWADQSGSGNNVTAGVGAVTKTASAINGLPGITFPGTASLVGAANAVTGARTCFVVVKSTVPTAEGCLIDFRTTGLEHGYFYGEYAGSDIYVYGDGVNDSKTATKASNNSAHIIMFSETGGNTGITYNVDGADCVVTNLAGGAQAQAAETGAAGFSIGRRDVYGIQGLTGHIAEIVLCNTVLSSDDILKVKTYLSTRYAITVV